MLFLARFILRGPSQAALVTSTMAVLGLIPLLGWATVIISSAAVALVSLVQGHRAGVMVMLYATAATALFAGFVLTMPWLALYFALMVWLPVWLIATVLARTLSLALSLQVLTLFSLLMIVVLSLFAGELSDLWQQTLTVMVEQIVSQSQGQLTVEQLEQTKQIIIRMLPGLFAGSVLIGSLLSLLLARWWQALLYHPGAFGDEFRGLQLGRVTALIALLIIMTAVAARTDMLLAMLIVVATLYLVQGLSVLHGVFASRKLNGVWLYLVYAILILFIPHSIWLLVVTGLADAWIDFRRRLAV